MSSNVFYRDLQKQYPTAVRGEGIYIYDEHGKRYLDGSSGALVVSVGHGNREIIESIYEQMNKISFAHTSQFQTENLKRYSKQLAEEAPEGLDYAYFLAGGSESVDTALKLARQYQIENGNPGKSKIIGRWPSFHGHTLGALSVGGYAAWRQPQSPNLIPFPHINAPLSYKRPIGMDSDSYHVQCALELEQMILREGPDTVAAFIFEPVIGASAGAIIAPNHYYEQIEQICKKYDVLLIADEVMSGFGRIGEVFASNHFNLKPDMIVSGKGISSGYAPLGLVMVHSKIHETIKNGSGRFLHGFTSSGNPISVTAGYAVLNYIKENKLEQHVKHIGSILKEKLDELYKKYDFIGDVRGLGLMWGIEFVENRKTRKSFPPGLALTNNVVRIAFENGLIVYPSQKFYNGVEGDCIMIAPPLVINEEQIDELIEKLYQTFDAVTVWLKK